MYNKKSFPINLKAWEFLRFLAATVLIVPIAGCLENDLSDLERFVAETKQNVVGKPLGPLPTVESYKPFYYEANNLKDPFSVSFFVLDALTRQEPIVDTGIRPDLDRDKEELEKYSLGSLDMVGTFSDFDNEEIWALIKAPDGIVHRVRKGNYLGENFGEIFNISEDKIEILEIVPDPQAGGWKERDNFLSLAQ